MFLPNSARAFGSVSRVILMRAFTKKWQYKVDSAYLDIRKTHVKQVGTKSEPCTDATNDIKITGCIAEYISDQIGCIPNIMGVNDSIGTMSSPPCNSTSDLNKFATIAEKLQFADTSTIYNMTGCLSTCEKYKFDIKMTDKIEAIYPSSSYHGHVTLYIIISMHDTSYVKEEHYLIYDFNSFIADVGGYMGLLLGSSILSLYDEIERLINTFVSRTTFKKL